MAIAKCPNNHYYDNVKYKECPHCTRAAIMGGNNQYNVELNSKTIPITEAERVGNSPNDKEEPIDSQKTVALNVKNGLSNPLTGWLVCIGGENKGRAFEIHMGKNFVGRSLKMDIVVNDPKIGRENHFTVVYEPKTIKFYVAQGNGITYYNDKLLSGSHELKENDTIEAGSSKYLFVPYCKKGRDWNE